VAWFLQAVTTVAVSRSPAGTVVCLTQVPSGPAPAPMPGWLRPTVVSVMVMCCAILCLVTTGPGSAEMLAGVSSRIFPYWRNAWP